MLIGSTMLNTCSSRNDFESNLRTTIRLTIEGNMDSTLQKIWASVFGVEALLIICGNAMAIRIFVQRKFLICKSSYLLVNLTVADVLVGISSFFTLLEVVYSSEGFLASCGSPMYNSINKFSLSFSIFTLLASLNSLALLAIERALAILIPLRFRRVKTVHYNYSIIISWLTSMMVLLRNISQCSDGFARNLLRSFMMVVTAVSITTIVLSYSAILLKVKYRPSIQVNSTMLNNIKLSKTLMLTTLCALVTWMPRYIAFLFLKLLSMPISSDVSLAFVMLIYSNSFANLFVYALRMPAFRKEMKNMILCAFARKNTVNPDVARVRRNDIELGIFAPRNDSTVSCSKVTVTISEQPISTD